MHRAVWLLVALLGVSAWSGPAFAGKALTDEDLDMVTAAGEPKVIIASSSAGTATAEHIDDAVFNLDIPTNAQQGLRALTVANVVGEAQLLVNLNILSVRGDVAGTDQRNFSVQSWGATLPILSETVAGVPGIDQSGCLGECKVNGNIGVVAAPGQIEIASASGDVIMHADGNLGSLARSDEEPVFNLKFAADSQVNLTSLFIANVVGRVQAAYNINIAAATLNLIPDANTPFALPFDSASGVIKQVNSGVQFRGTPLGVGNTAAVINVTHSPN